MIDSVISKRTYSESSRIKALADLAYIKSHSGLFIGIAPYVFGLMYRGYTTNLYKKEDGLYTY